MRNNKTHAEDCKCLSWKPVLVGGFVATGLSFLLYLFSVATELTAFTTNSEGIESLALGGLIGTALGTIASMFGAGWLSGYLAQRHCSKRHLGALYGFLVWCVALIIAAFLNGPVHQYVGYYGQFLSGMQDGGYPANMMNHAMSGVNHLQSQQLVISTYIVFILFFLSAFACSLGGHCGMQYESRRQS